MSSAAKLYDMVLSHRFRLWHLPRIEQAGAQRGRGCQEQILTLRLLIDFTRHKKRQLYILFVDYCKAYDKVDRMKLLRYLDRRGCGSKFLAALKSSYEKTSAQIGSSSFTATAGVRQGASTSCPLFIFFLEPTIDAVCQLGPDDWLGNLHTLLLMDDTVLLATSRQQMSIKLATLKRTADAIGMTINESKSQFICINSDNKEPFIADEVTIRNTDSYTYLGTPISSKCLKEQVKDHIRGKTRHALKFASFLSKNFDAPYVAKKIVWSSALKAAIFYSCETWLTLDLRAAEYIYNSTLKNLLSVRGTTCNDIVFAECGEFGAKSHIRNLQILFLKKLISQDYYQGSYLEMVMNLAMQSRCPAGKVLHQLLQTNVDYKSQERDRVHSLISSSTNSTRRLAYRALNPTLSVHEAYLSLEVPESDRIAFTRIRLSSHHLSFEKGRWSRIPAENRFCPCGAIQSDTHVMLQCPYTQAARDAVSVPNGCADLAELFNTMSTKSICTLCKAVLNCKDYA